MCMRVSVRVCVSMYIVVLVCSLLPSTGFDILESYRDRVCDSLPTDYNTTAGRLQTLIGASDHMVQWVLTGDMSQVNQRIYQIVLVKEWCQPHFIKFCDIMEVLADDSITVGHIKALRKGKFLYMFVCVCVLNIKLLSIPCYWVRSKRTYSTYSITVGHGTAPPVR